MRKQRKKLKLPVSLEVLSEWIIKLVQNPKATTLMKIALLIDECHALALNPKHSIPRHFEVGAKWAEGRLSRVRLKDGSSVRGLKLLVLMGLIVKTASHRANIAPRATQYRFTTEDFREYELELPKFLFEKGERIRVRKGAKRDSRVLWIERSLEMLSLSKANLRKLKKSENHREALERFVEGRRHVTNARGVYFTHCVSSFPNWARSKLIFDGYSAAVQLDISGAHPVVLPWLVEDTILADARKGGGKDDALSESKTELARLRERLSEEDFYSEMMPDQMRNAAKKNFLRSLNGATDPDAMQAARDLAEHYPISARIIRGRRFKDTRAFSDELQGRVSTIIMSVVERCRLGGIPCVPISDELIVPLAHRLEVWEWLHSEIFQRTGVRAKIDGMRLF